MTVDQLSLLMDKAALWERQSRNYGAPEIRAYDARCADAMRACLAEAKAASAETDANWPEAQRKVTA